MKSCSVSSLEDHVLLRHLTTALSQDHGTTAILLGLIAETEERKLYVPAGYSSMHPFCVKELHMSEDAAYKRIRAGRAARQFPAILPALADGRLNLSAVVLLAPHLKPDNAGELLAASAHKTNAEIELLLAERFPRPDVPTFLQPLPDASNELAVRPVEASDLQLAPRPMVASDPQLAVRPVATIGGVNTPAPRARIAPLSPGKFALQATMRQEMYEKLRYAQALLGHALPSGDVMQVLERGLDSLVEGLEKKKFAKCVRSRPRRSSANDRYVPAEIRQKVWQRDGGQCTFVSEKGRRCEARDRLEFDHVDPVARGGQTSADRTRLLCRAHNQYAAECTFGRGFMHEKRQEARRQTLARKEAHAQKQAQALGRARVQTREQECARDREVQAKARAQTAATAASDVIPVLRELRFSAEEARRGAALCAHMPDAPLEERVRVALRGLAPNCVRRPAPVAS
jgi:5-methylcytosine-specific restriction endonuclease McrA